MIISFKEVAEPDVVFAEASLLAHIGRPIKLNYEGRAWQAYILDAKVIEEGRAVTLTLDIPGFELPEPVFRGQEPFSAELRPRIL